MSDTNAKRILDGNQSRPSMQVLDAAQAEDAFMLLQGRDGALLVRVIASDLGTIPVEFGSAPDVVIPGGVAVTNFPSGFEVSNFPSPLTDDVVAVAPVVGEKTITQTAAALFAGSSALANRQLMRVRNLSLDQQVLVGPSTVAGTGFPVEPGGEYLFKFNKAVAVPVYAMSPGAAAKVRVMEA